MTPSLFSHYRNRLVFLSAWLFWAALQTYGLRGFGWEVALADSAVTNGLLALACLFTARYLRFYGPRKNQYIYMLVWACLLTVLWWALSVRALQAMFPDQADYLLFWREAFPVRMGIVLLVIGGMELFSTLWRVQQEQKTQEQRRGEAEKLAREAELYKLRQQLQPHFLFNSLNSIHALVGSRPEEARKMILQLSDFLRGTLKKDDEQWTTLTEELQHLQLYLSIERVRFGHRLRTVITCEEPCHEALLPPMVLQPVVENAIKFGLYDTTEAVTITIHASAQEGLLVITVANPFDPHTAPPRQGTGFGLSGVQRRLYLLFARNDLLESRGEGEIFTTVIKIPQR